jgi:hypothetical protein
LSLGNRIRTVCPVSTSVNEPSRLNAFRGCKRTVGCNKAQVRVLCLSMGQERPSMWSVRKSTLRTSVDEL